jgi:hypothetical protein
MSMNPRILELMATSRLCDLDRDLESQVLRRQQARRRRSGATRWLGLVLMRAGAHLAGAPNPGGRKSHAAI